MYKEKDINKLPPHMMAAFLNFERLNPGCDLFDFQRFLIQDLEKLYLENDKKFFNTFGVENIRLHYTLMNKVKYLLINRENYNSDLLEIYLIVLMQNYILNNRKKFISWEKYKSKEVNIQNSLDYIKFFVTLIRWYNNKVFNNQDESTDHMLNVHTTIKTAKFADNIENLVLDLFKLTRAENLEDLMQLLRLYYLPNSSKSQKLQFLTQAIFRVSYYRMDLHKNGITFSDNFIKISSITHELTQNIPSLTQEAKNYDIELNQLFAKYSSTNFINEIKTKLPKICYETLVLQVTCYNILKADPTLPETGVIQLEASFKMVIDYLLEYNTKKHLLDYKIKLIKNNNDLIYYLSVLFKNNSNIQSETLLTNKFYDLNLNSIKLLQEFSL